MNSFELKFPNMSNQNLKLAADKFIYLTFCPGTLNQWLVFYKDLFETKSLSQILMTLNRIIKMTKENQMSDFLNAFDYFHKFAKLIFKRVASSLQQNKEYSSINGLHLRGMYEETLSQIH